MFSLTLAQLLKRARVLTGRRGKASELARRLCPDNFGAEVGLGFALLRSGNTGRSDSLFRSVLTQHPGNSDAWDGHARAALRLGDSLESVNRRNGRGMTMQMFGADYGGTVNDFGGGTLAGVMGDCEPAVVFAFDGKAVPAKSLMGDGEIASDHPEISTARAYVDVLGVHFAPPTDQ